jgi:thiol-disulfide isomerase/thioredoxin
VSASAGAPPSANARAGVCERDVLGLDRERAQLASRAMLLAALSLLLVPQVPPAPGAKPTGGAAAPAAAPAPVEPTRVALSPKAPNGADNVPWSPKGASVPLTRDGDVLRGAFRLGPAAAPEVRVELARSAGSEHFDLLALDCDRDGAFTDDERQTTQPKDQRGKWWSSFTATVQVPHGVDAAARVPYPMSLWFVADPREPDAAPALRWSRRGWHEGTFAANGRTVHVLVTEMTMDGAFDRKDAWQLGGDRAAMLKAPARGLDTHAWLDGVAFRAVAVAADGRELSVQPFDPGITEAEERKRADRLEADRAAARAPQPLAFGKDLPVALADAKRSGKRVFVDFVTTWCGPCKEMDRLVYTAADVVAAAADVIAIKLDGDDERELAKRYEVKAYPTLLLLDGDGAVLRRAVGYQGVAATVQFLAK